MRNRFSILLTALAIGGLDARAQLDSESQKLLIEKLNKVYLELAPQDPSKVPVTLRLADLYAERARQNSQNGCPTCPNPQADREKALRLYTEVLDQAPEASRTRVMVQVGHLYQLNGRDDLAVKYYKKVLAGDAVDAAVKAEAHLSMGEIAFKKRDYKGAIQRYDEVMNLPSTGSKGFAAYRRAWSQFHLGQRAQALESLRAVLSTPELLSRNASRHGQVDVQFQEEVSRDLTTFMAADKITLEGIESLYKLSPETTRVGNVQTLAMEAERLGKKDEALLSLNFISGKLSNPKDRVAAQVVIAQLQLDRGDKEAALKGYETAMQLWKELGFEDSPAQQELRRRARNLPVSWNQMEKKTPSPELLSAYEFFLGMFGQDIDMHLYAAQTGKEIKNWQAAWKHYSAARALAAVDTEKLETILLSQLELGELSSDPVLVSQAYDDYIQYSRKKSKLLEVQYQKAHLAYEKGDNASAAEQLRVVALGGGDARLRKQAADLALDALVLLKDDARLTAWAREFESTFPQSRADYSQVIQKSMITKSATLAVSDPAAALAALSEFDPAQATPEDKLKYYKNRLLLAEKLNRIAEASAAADALLAQPGLTAEDRELAWSRKAYFAEIRLDFPTAFTATEKLAKSLSPEEKNFKLAVFAELAGKSGAPFYIKYLGQTKDEERKRLVAVELVRKSDKAEADIERVRPVLAGTPELLGDLYAEIYAKTGSEKVLVKVLRDPTLRNTAGGRMLARQAFLRDFAKVKAPLVSDKLDSKSSNRLAQSIKRRAVLLQKAEGAAKKAIESGDWTAQLVSIDLVARESERFYSELMSAPMPAGLTAEEEQQYLSLLSAQAAPFQTKAAEGKAKVDQFWQADWMKPLERSWEQKSLRKLLSVEIAQLSAVAPDGQRGKLNKFVTVDAGPASVSRPSLQEIQAARRKVYDNPLDKSALEELLVLERKTDNSAMSEYLATRLDKLNTKGSL